MANRADVDRGHLSLYDGDQERKARANKLANLFRLLDKVELPDEKKRPDQDRA